MECYFCKVGGHVGSVATRIITWDGQERGVCNDHLPDKSFPAIVQMPPKSVGAIRESAVLKENEMPRKMEIDENELRRLHAQGLADGAIGAQLGCAASTIHLRRKRLGLPSNGGRRPSGSVGTTRRVPRTKSHSTMKIVKVERPGIVPVPKAPAQDDGNVSGQPKARCRVAMFEVEGSAEAILQAVEAVKAALTNK